MSAQHLADILRGALAANHVRQYIPGDTVTVHNGTAEVRVTEVDGRGAPTPYRVTVTPERAS